MSIKINSKKDYLEKRYNAGSADVVDELKDGYIEFLEEKVKKIEYDFENLDIAFKDAQVHYIYQDAREKEDAETIIKLQEQVKELEEAKASLIKLAEYDTKIILEDKTCKGCEYEECGYNTRVEEFKSICLNCNRYYNIDRYKKKG